VVVKEPEVAVKELEPEVAKELELELEPVAEKEPELVAEKELELEPVKEPVVAAKEREDPRLSVK